MDVEAFDTTEDMRHILSVLPKDIDANWPNRLDFNDYIKKLQTFNVQNLNKEIQKLKEEGEEVSIQTQDLAITNYKKFIETAENSRNIFHQFESTETRLDELINKIPHFEQQCKQVIADSEDISVHRKLSTLTFIKNAQLTEFLQLPQLMEKCIVDGNYEDALEIVDFIRRLTHKHSSIHVFSILLTEVEKLWLIMVQKLLSQLRTDIQLPKCLQAVGYLRCMNIFTEAELRLKFLQTRDSWLQTLLEEIPRDKASQHLCKTIELSRIHIFHIITQYNAIFCDDANTTVLKTDNNINESAIFQSWIEEKISQFLKTMEQDLAESEGSSFGSSLSQCMYFGLSFSRVGCDFRALAGPIITRSVLNHFKRFIEETSKKFKKDMECFTLINKVYSNASKKSTSTANKLEKVQDFYPLAEYCNGLLTAFNELRICAPLSIVCKVTQVIQQSLMSVSAVILLFYQQEHQAFTDVAMEQFSCFCKCFVYELVPHIQQCIRTIYPAVLIATHLGVTAQFLEKGKYISLDRDAILESIEHLLPLRIDPDVQTENIDEATSKSIE